MGKYSQNFFHVDLTLAFYCWITSSICIQHVSQIKEFINLFQYPITNIQILISINPICDQPIYCTTSADKQLCRFPFTLHWLQAISENKCIKCLIHKILNPNIFLRKIGNSMNTFDCLHFASKDIFLKLLAKSKHLHAVWLAKVKNFFTLLDLLHFLKSVNRLVGNLLLLLLFLDFT